MRIMPSQHSVSSVVEYFFSFIFLFFLFCLAATMSQNNGVIALTRCASRRVGYACCAWLLGVYTYLGVHTYVYTPYIRIRMRHEGGLRLLRLAARCTYVCAYAVYTPPYTYLCVYTYVFVYLHQNVYTHTHALRRVTLPPPPPPLNGGGGGVFRDF